MEQKARRAILTLLLLFCAATVFAQSTEPRLSPTQFAVELGKASAPLSVSQLIEASLRFSGADAATIASDTARLEKIVAEAKQAVAPYSTDYEKGDQLLIFMHKRLLTHYSEPQTRVDTLLRTGQFNCVSSAVLYMILGRAIGLHVEGVYTPDHAFCTVKARGRLVDVETTNRYGFDPGTKTAFHDAFGNTGFTYVPPGNYRLRTATDGRGLLSFILQNRMSLLERQYRFAEAVGLAVDRYAVLGTKAALNDLASEAGNYCALLNQRREYAKGITFVDAVEKRYGKLPRLVKLMNGLVHNEVLRFTNAGQYQEALTLIRERSAAGSIDASNVASLKRMVTERQLAEVVNKQPFADALAKVEQSYRQGDIQKSQYQSYLVAVFGKEAQSTAAKQGYLAAAKVLEQGIKLTGGDPQLERGRQVYINNYVATVHNRFAALFNNQEYTKARQIVDEGLKIVPDSSILNQDLSLLQQATGR